MISSGWPKPEPAKRLAFGLPLIDHLLAQPGKPDPKTAKALILAPTRELVNQIAESLRNLTKKTKLRVATVVGGQSIGKQIAFPVARHRHSGRHRRPSDRPDGARRR